MEALVIRNLSRPKGNRSLGAGCMLLADLFCSVQAVCIKAVLPDFNVPTLVMFRGVIGLLAFYVALLCMERRGKLRTLYRTKSLGLQMLRATSGFCTAYMFYYSIFVLPLGTAVLLFYLYPVLTPFVVRIWFRVRLLKRLLIGICIAFVGVALVMHPHVYPLNGKIFVPVVGAVLGAINLTGTRLLYYKEESADTVNAYYFSVGALLSILTFFAVPAEHVNVLTSRSLLLALATGCAACFYQSFLNLSTKYASSRFLSTFVYGIFLFSAIWDRLFFGYVPEPVTRVGFGLIVIGTILLVALYPRKNDLVLVRDDVNRTDSA
ncbi:MAG: DMT family transporter [Simkaniaceae bacterium]|nr:DMT family transporter [Simkaniaceae bacterium]